MVFVATGRDRLGRSLPLEDPLADRLRAAVGGAESADGIVEGLLGVEEVFGPDLRDCVELKGALVESVESLLAEQRAGAVGPA
jgi:fructuronate reductase